jgi:predicted chitinase
MDERLLVLSNEQIAKVLNVTPDRIESHWPAIDACLAALCQNYSDAVKIAALATIRIECPPFKPIHEMGSRDYIIRHYANRADLGNAGAADAWAYRGAGYIQITGRFNFAHYGKLLGIDLIDDAADPNDDQDPEKALNPDTSAAIFAAYFHEHKCDIAANAQEWTRVRKLVNGGTNQLDEFLLLVQLLAQAAGHDDMAASAAQQLKEHNAHTAAASA